MSNASNKSTLAPTLEQLRNLRKKPKINEGVSEVKTDNVEVPIADPAKTTPQSTPVVPAEPKRLSLSFPANYCCFDGTASVKAELGQLLFPAAREHLKWYRVTEVLAESAAWNLQGIQGMLTAREHVVNLERQFDLVKKSEKNLREKSVKDGELISKLKDNNKRLAGRNKELVEYGKKKREDVLDAAAYYVFKTRAELMREFKEGKSSEWDPDADIKIWLEEWADTIPPGADDGFKLEDDVSPQDEPVPPSTAEKDGVEKDLVEKDVAKKETAEKNVG